MRMYCIFSGCRQTVVTVADQVIAAAAAVAVWNCR